MSVLDVGAKVWRVVSLRNAGQKGVFTALIVFYGMLFSASFWLYMTLNKDDDHWLSRVGGSVVTISLALSLFQFCYERWMEVRITKTASVNLKKYKEVGFSDEEAQGKVELYENGTRKKIERMRFIILFNTLFCAAIGELLHSFGDLFIR